MAAVAIKGLARPSCHSFSTKADGLATLVLLRHGESTYNEQPSRFSGWIDSPLTSRGIAEAKASGDLLRERNYTKFDYAFTSTLQRAVVTCELALENAKSADTPMKKAWQLNERHYGALQGHEKKDPKIVEKYGQEQLTLWRKDFHAVPPAMDETHPHYAPPPAPLAESLANCQVRVLDFWKNSILPTLTPNRTVLLAAHSNTLRVLVTHLDQVPIEMVPHVQIPNSVPCIYHFDPNDGQVVSPILDSAAGGSRGGWLFSPENHKRLRGKIGGSGGFIRCIFEAWDLNKDGVLSLQEVEKGLKDLMGGDDIVVSALAGQILQEVDIDGSQTLDLEEFESHALDACRKFTPGLLEGVEKEMDVCDG
mmetsp:Transcript_29904/g.54250  ORF Transcript_29904/g.54250 Transcript_29904/m.54250 type:complete len:365 (-) Transcript_29904:88-1182(-)